MRVIAMFRVSTERQATEGASLDAQARIYHENASRLGWTTVGEFRGFESAALAAVDRQVLQRVLAALRELQPDALYVHEQSRLTRGDELEVALLLRELRERRVKVLVGGVVRDLSSIDERFMLGIQSLVDRAEYERIRERVMRGKRQRALEGKKNCGLAPYGYRNPSAGSPERGRLQVVESEAAVVRRIFGWAATGIGSRAIAERLRSDGQPAPKGGQWAKSSVTRILRNPAYAGTHVTGGWVAKPGSRTFRFDPSGPNTIIVENAHPAIIDRETWAAVHSRPPRPKTAIPRMLTGMIHINGARASGDNYGGRSFYRARPAMPGIPWLPTEQAETAAWQAFESLVLQPDLLSTLLSQGTTGPHLNDLRARIAAAEASVRRYTARQARLVEMRADGEINKSEFIAQSDIARKGVAEAEHTIRTLKSQLTASDNGQIVAAMGTLRPLVEGSTLLTLGQRRQIMRSVITRVDLRAERLEVKQARNSRGRFGSGSANRWTIRDVTLHLVAPLQADGPSVHTHRAGRLDTTSRCCARPRRRPRSHASRSPDP